MAKSTKKVVKRAYIDKTAFNSYSIVFIVRIINENLTFVPTYTCS